MEFDFQHLRLERSDLLGRLDEIPQRPLFTPEEEEDAVKEVVQRVETEKITLSKEMGMSVDDFALLNAEMEIKDRERKEFEHTVQGHIPKDEMRQYVRGNSSPKDNERYFAHAKGCDDCLVRLASKYAYSRLKNGNT